MIKITALKQSGRKPRAADDSPATETVGLSLRLLERLASSKESIGVSDLAREFDASKATIYRHLQALVLHGFVHQEAKTARYVAGIKLFILGERLRERFDSCPWRARIWRGCATRPASPRPCRRWSRTRSSCSKCCRATRS